MSKNINVPCLVGKTAVKIKNFLNHKLKEHHYNITVDQIEILGIVHENGGLSQSEIAEITSKDKTGITRIIDVMEKNGIVERRKNETDRRAYKIFLTEKALKMNDEIQMFVFKEQNKIIANLATEDLQALDRILTVIEQNMD